MSFCQSEFTKRYEFEIFYDEPLIHGVFTRNGGVSPQPWNSLNLGGLNGDTRANVVENRRRIFFDMGRAVDSIYDVWQVHGTDVICTDAPRPLDSPHLKADAILTNQPGVTLFMRFADCVPIFFFDPIRKVVGMAHAGWQGTVKKIAAITVERMRVEYGCRPQDMKVGIGPSIGPDHYEVGPDVIEHAHRAFGDDGCLLHENHGRIHLDLWEANRQALEEVGVRHIQIAGICTACDTHEWYSHRAEHGKTGRFGAILALT